MTLITSPSNPRIKALQTLHTTRGRKKSGLFLMEGPHLLEALLDARLLPHEVYYQPELLQRTARGRELLDRLFHTTDLPREQLVEVSERVMQAVSDVQTAQGVVCVLPCASFEPEHIRARHAQRAAGRRPALLILDDLADPGNMGTILRTALAADVQEALLTPHCVDYFSPKVIRAAAGAHLALPVWSNLSWEAIGERVEKHCGRASERVFLAEASGAHPYFAENLTQPFALIIGNEAHGPSQEARALACRAISIPLANQVESLNAAMATGIILFEAARQFRLS